MKIALAYHFNEEKPDPWNTPIGIGKSFEKKGHIVNHYSLDPKECNISKLLIEADKHDIIFFCWCGPSKSFDEQLEILKTKTKTKIFLELGDEPQTKNDNRERIKYVDAFFTPDLRCHKEYISRGLPSHWMTHWCDDSVFYKKENTNRKNICVTSCIGYRPLINEFTQIFKDKFVNKNVWGYDNTDYFNSGTFTYQFARFDEITRRIFESGGCGNAIITNRISPETGIYDLFIEDEDICYFSTVQEAYEKMLRLYQDHEYRNKLATNIHKKIVENHLVGNRVDQILKVFYNL
jgi:spore maturation protein CgeB